jgi:hypothetical protein
MSTNCTGISSNLWSEVNTVLTTSSICPVIGCGVVVSCVCVVSLVCTCTSYCVLGETSSRVCLLSIFVFGVQVLVLCSSGFWVVRIFCIVLFG